MKTLEATIEKGKDGLFSIYIPSIAGLFGTGETEEEAKEALQDAIDMALEYVEETGKWGDYAPLQDKYKIEYVYDLSGFFKRFNFFDASALATYVGINQSLMRRYKTGRTKASRVQKTKISTGIRRMARELSAVTF